MDRAARAALLLAFGLAACAGPRFHSVGSAPPPTRAELMRSLLPANVRVNVLVEGEVRRTASGVVIQNGQGAERELVVSHVLTNAHVVLARAGELPRFVVLVDGEGGSTQEFEGEVVAVGDVEGDDLAVLAIEGIALPCAPLSDDSAVNVGDDVLAVAAPFGRSLSVSRGIVSQIDYDAGSPRRPLLLKTDASIGYGSSGGGLYSASNGALLGVLAGYRTAAVSFLVGEERLTFDVPMPGETFAAPAARVRAFLGAHGLAALRCG